MSNQAQSSRPDGIRSSDPPPFDVSQHPGFEELVHIAGTEYSQPEFRTKLKKYGKPLLELSPDQEDLDKSYGALKKKHKSWLLDHAKMKASQLPRWTQAPSSSISETYKTDLYAIRASITKIKANLAQWEKFKQRHDVVYGKTLFVHQHRQNFLNDNENQARNYLKQKRVDLWAKVPERWIRYFDTTWMIDNKLRSLKAQVQKEESLYDVTLRQYNKRKDGIDNMMTTLKEALAELERSEQELLMLVSTVVEQDRPLARSDQGIASAGGEHDNQGTPRFKGKGKKKETRRVTFEE